MCVQCYTGWADHPVIRWCLNKISVKGLPRWLSGEGSTCQSRRHESIPGSRKILKSEIASIPVFLPENFKARGLWQATVMGLESQVGLLNWNATVLCEIWNSSGEKALQAKGITCVKALRWKGQQGHLHGWCQRQPLCPRLGYFEGPSFCVFPKPYTHSAPMLMAWVDVDWLGYTLIWLSWS